MLLREAFNYWMSVARRNSGTARRYLAAVRRLEPLGLRNIEDVTRDRVLEVQALLLARGLGNVYVRAELAAVRAIAAQLELHGRFPTGTLAEVRKVALEPERLRRRRARHCDRREFEALAAAAVRYEPRVELPIRVAAYLGPRVGELARMRAEDYIGRSFVIETMPDLGEAGTCKTGPRTVPVCEELSDLVRERLPRSGWLFPSNPGARAWRSKTPFLSAFLLERGIRIARRKAGLADDLTFTVLRHTRASWWLQGGPPDWKGASIYKVADWLGHSVVTCERSYGSLRDGYDPECERMPAA